jgi:hypothetical protein
MDELMQIGIGPMPPIGRRRLEIGRECSGGGQGKIGKAEGPGHP